MTYTIEETQQSGIWSVTYEGPVSLTDRLQALEVGRGVLEKRLASGILIDFRQAELHACEEDACGLARERVSSSLLLGVRVALLFDKVPPAAEFEVLVARNRGLVVSLLVLPVGASATAILLRPCSQRGHRLPQAGGGRQIVRLSNLTGGLRNRKLGYAL